MTPELEVALTRAAIALGIWIVGALLFAWWFVRRRR